MKFIFTFKMYVPAPALQSPNQPTNVLFSSRALKNCLYLTLKWNVTWPRTALMSRLITVARASFSCFDLSARSVLSARFYGNGYIVITSPVAFWRLRRRVQPWRPRGAAGQACWSSSRWLPHRSPPSWGRSLHPCLLTHPASHQTESSAARVS